MVLFWNFAVCHWIKKSTCKFLQSLQLLYSTSANWDSPVASFSRVFFSLSCLFSMKLICARTAKAVWTGLCPCSTMVPTHLFVIHKSWLFRACQNAALAPVPTHLLDNESSGKYRHKMAAGVSAALFNWEENRQAGPNFKDLWRKMETKSEFYRVFFSGRLCPLLKFNQLQHTHSTELLTVNKSIYLDGIMVSIA